MPTSPTKWPSKRSFATGRRERAAPGAGEGGGPARRSVGEPGSCRLQPDGGEAFGGRARKSRQGRGGAHGEHALGAIPGARCRRHRRPRHRDHPRSTLPKKGGAHVIAWLRGDVRHAEGNRAVLDVRGVGYEIFGPGSDVGRWGSAEGSIEVFVSTDVREDAITLYAFSDEQDRVTFGRLRAVNGWGRRWRWRHWMAWDGRRWPGRWPRMTCAR